MPLTVVLGPDPGLRSRVAHRLAHERRTTVVAAGGDEDCGSAARAAAAAEGMRTGAVVDAAGLTRPLDLHTAHEGDGALELVAAIDARGVRDGFRDERWADAGDGSWVARASVLAEQIEDADAVVVAGSSSLGKDALARTLALIGHLAPSAQLVVESDRPLRIRRRTDHPDHDRGAGWTRVLNGVFEPAFRHPEVSTFRYTQPLPFHPRRVNALLQGPWAAGRYGRVVRSVGFVRLATRPGITGFWDQAGGMISLEPGQADSETGYLSFGQDLAITGIGLDERALVRDLDACALRPAELDAGPELWAHLVDPFPAWERTS